MNRLRSTTTTGLATLITGALLATACADNTNATATEALAPTTTAPPDPAPTTTTEAAPTTTTTPPDPAPTTTTEAAPTTTTTPPDPAPTTAAALPVEWEQVLTGEDCVCADGSPYSFWVREADPSRVVFYLMGGGACFSAETCSFINGTYTVTADVNIDIYGADGIFDHDNPANPVAGYSFVFVPYCTGDVHIGTATHTYSPDLTVNHTGFFNATKALDELEARFGSADEIVVAGSSAGSAAAPLFGGLASDRYPDARITVVADASGAYPSVPAVNATIGGLWGAERSIPDWPVNNGLTMTDIGLPGLFVQSGRHDPDIRFARYDNAYDQTQVFYAELAGFSADRMDELILANEASIEAAGVPVDSYLAPGDDHTILGRPEMYTQEVEGIAFIDWLTAVIKGEPVDDVHCQDCAPPA